jgi:hypothetical protein
METNMRRLVVGLDEEVRMTWSHALWIMGLGLALMGCATGTEEPSDSNLGTPSGDSYSSDSGGVGTPPSPGSGSGSTTPPGRGESSYDSGFGSGKSSYDEAGSSDYVGGSSYYDGGSYDSGSTYYDSGSGGGETVCMGYAPPDVSAACTGCKTPPCQANGCYGGYWCEVSADSCHEDPPSGCSK